MTKHLRGSTTGMAKAVSCSGERPLSTSNREESWSMNYFQRSSRRTLRICEMPLLKHRMPHRKAHSALDEDDNMREMIDKGFEYPATDMGDFWVSFIEMSEPLVQSNDACHARNGPEYISSIYTRCQDSWHMSTMNMQGGCLIIRQCSHHCQMKK